VPGVEAAADLGYVVVAGGDVVSCRASDSLPARSSTAQGCVAPRCPAERVGVPSRPSHCGAPLSCRRMMQNTLLVRREPEGPFIARLKITLRRLRRVVGDIRDASGRFFWRADCSPSAVRRCLTRRRCLPSLGATAGGFNRRLRSTRSRSEAPVLGRPLKRFPPTVGHVRVRVRSAAANSAAVLSCRARLRGAVCHLTRRRA